MKRKLIYPAIGLAAAILVAVSYCAGFFTGLENFFEDILFTSRPVSGDIVIIAIDDESIQRVGQWPWPREVFARALANLENTKPASVGLDVIFAEPSRVGAADDAALAATLKSVSYPVIFPVEEIPSGLLKPLPIFENNVRLGHVNLNLDNDGVARRFPLKLSDYNSFGYESVSLAGKEIPDESSLEEINRIVFSAKPGAIRRIPFWQVLDGEVDSLTGKIVLIGATAADLHDDKPTPLGRDKEMAGVEIHANIANMLLLGYRLTPLAAGWTLLWILIAALIPLTAPAHLIAAIILFQNGISVNILHTNFAWILSAAAMLGYRYFLGEKEKRQLKNIFSKYVSPAVLKQILRDPSRVALGGEEKEITVLFSDIRGFTTISEKTSPKELVLLLNRYFSAVTEAILQNGGMVDKYIGDAVMAFWGAPIEDVDQADKALKGALGMLKKLNELNQELKAGGEPEINIGIGLYTGPAIVGNVGSQVRLNYTAIGDTVNVSSRLEGLTKEHKVQLIVGESTKNKIKNSYDFKPLGSVAVKGRAETVKIYTL